MPILLLIIGIIFLGALILVFIAMRRKKLSPSQKKEILHHLKTALALPLPEQLLELDKLLSYTLQHKGYVGSMGEQLKKSGKILQDENGVWNAHKMRNRLAHEVGVAIDEKELRKACKTLKKEIEGFLE